MFMFNYLYEKSKGTHDPLFPYLLLVLLIVSVIMLIVSVIMSIDMIFLNFKITNFIENKIKNVKEKKNKNDR